MISLQGRENRYVNYINKKKNQYKTQVISGCLYFPEYFKSSSYNVVCVDWSVIALDLLYVTARLRSKEIGHNVADLISMLVNNSNQTVDDIHMIGFSIGAHIAGYAGKRLEGQVQRITGIDK